VPSGRHSLVIHTIGHSTRQASELMDLLERYAIRTLVDIRRYPRSRRYPHFNSELLVGTCAERGVEYVHLGALGGRRRPRRDSINTALKNESFRGYADHMKTAEFSEGLGKLLRLAENSPTAMMCAEALWWQCHRALLSDTLVALGHTVRHIVSAAPPNCHTLSEFAQELDGSVTYRGLL
jgi:uncharacterized protein (DUF488 family)